MRVPKSRYLGCERIHALQLMYRSKEEIHSEIELTIYLLNWYSPTNIISHALLVLRPKLFLQLTEIFQYWYLTNLPPVGRVWQNAFFRWVLR